MTSNLEYIPLRIEDIETGNIIADSNLYLRIERTSTGGRILTASIPEGSFRVEIDRQEWETSRKLDYDEEKWMKQLDILLPADDDGFHRGTNERQVIDQEREEKDQDKEDIDQEKHGDDDIDRDGDGDQDGDEQNELELHAKLRMNSRYYENNRLVDDYYLAEEFLTVSIRTTVGVLKKTYGSFRIPANEEEVDIFEWMKSLIDSKTQLIKARRKDQRTIQHYESEIAQYKQSLAQSEENHDKIIQDLSVNFQHILATKKEKILQLMTENQKGFKVNELYKEKEKNNLENMILDEDKLDQLPDELPERVVKRKAGNHKSPRKRSKVKIQTNAHNHDSDFEPSANGTDEDNDLLKMTDRDIINTVMGDLEHEEEDVKHEPTDFQPEIQDQRMTDVSDSDAEYINKELESSSEPNNSPHQQPTQSNIKKESSSADIINDSLTDYSE